MCWVLGGHQRKDVRVVGRGALYQAGKCRWPDSNSDLDLQAFFILF